MALNRMLVGSVAIAGTVAALAAVPVASAEPRDLFLDELATLNIQLIGGNQADTSGAFRSWLTLQSLLIAGFVGGAVPANLHFWW